MYLPDVLDVDFAPRSVLQCVVVCCSVLQSVAECCSVLQDYLISLTLSSRSAGISCGYEIDAVTVVFERVLVTT